MTKMTKREFYKAILAIESISAEVREYAEASIQKLDETNAKRSSKQTKTQLANEPIKAKILEILSTAPMTSAVLREKFVANGEEISVQKVSSLCRQLVEEGFLSSNEIKVPKKGAQKQYSVIITEGEKEE